jgi:RNA polymerase sigma factor (sigma-70 family)
MTINDRGPEPVGLAPSFASSQAPAPGNLVDMHAGWIDFYDAHYHRVVRFVMQDGACLDDARDAVQEAFVESWTLQASDPAKWAAITNKMAWIRVVALRKYRRPPGPRTRPRLARDAEIPDLPYLGPDPGELTVQTQMVLQALRNLDEEARAVMAFDLDDFPTADIAAALEITEQRVRDVKKKARAGLKPALAGLIVSEGRQPR